MADSDKVYEISRTFEKYFAKPDSADLDHVKSMLAYLEKAEITLAIIQKSRIGLHVNNIRKVLASEELNSKAKKLCKNWKKLILQNAPNAKPNTKPAKDGETSKDEKPKPPMPSAAEPAKPKTATPVPRSALNNNNGGSDGGVRGRYRQMLASALIPDDDDEDKDQYKLPENLAYDIEEEIFKDLQRPDDPKYRNRVISRVSNLRDKKNPDFKKNCLIGLISPARIAVMSHNEMASKELAELRKEYIKQGINDAQMAFSGGTTTSDIKCPVCRKFNVTYNQVQTRSADEPMTTFCLCNECGKRWKFC